MELTSDRQARWPRSAAGQICLFLLAVSPAAAQNDPNCFNTNQVPGDVGFTLSTCILAGSGPVQAKCPFVRYVVEGKVSIPPSVDHKSVKIYLFLQGSDRPSDYPPDPGKVDFAVPREDGSFQAESWLNTVSARGDGCDRVETSADMFVTGEAIQGKRVIVEFPQSPRRIRKELNAFATCDVVLEALPRKGG